MKTIQIVTRNSPLALIQAEIVKGQLEEGGLSVDLIPISTKGDQILDTTIAKIGSKGVFTEELEGMLQSGDADIAVHSAKDLASEVPEGFSIISIGKRESTNDVLISNQPVNINSKLVVGTSSTRRVAQLSRKFPDLEIVPIRGNLQTRIAKMEAGGCDALVLSKAGVKRMGFAEMIQHVFSLEELTPSAGQGSIAVEAYETIQPTIRKLIKSATNDSDSLKRILAERSFLSSFGGGCSIPVFAHATLINNEVQLHAGILSMDGKKSIEATIAGADPEELGQLAAKNINDQGGDEILRSIKEQLGYL